RQVEQGVVRRRRGVRLEGERAERVTPEDLRAGAHFNGRCGKHAVCDRITEHAARRVDHAGIAPVVRAAPGTNRLTSRPTLTHTTAPVSTYHVHASGVATRTATMNASDVPMPVMTPVSDVLVVRTPSRNAPSIGPYTMDAIVSPTVNTDPHPRAR